MDFARQQAALNWAQSHPALTNWVMDQQAALNRPQPHPALASWVMDPMQIFWDMENCPVPKDVEAHEVTMNVRKAIRQYPMMQLIITSFTAYADLRLFPTRVKEGCQRTGVTLSDVPNGKKDASDKAILVDMMLFVKKNPPPCTIFLISGDVDFAPALHKLGDLGYDVILAVPSGVNVSPCLRNAGSSVWDWPSLARGLGLVPAKNESFSTKNHSDDTGGDKRPATSSSRHASGEKMSNVSSSVSVSSIVPSLVPSLAGLSFSRHRSPGLPFSAWSGPSYPKSAHSPDPVSSPRSPLDRRSVESLEVNGIVGQSIPASGPSDFSDFSADERINEGFWTSNLCLDLATSVSINSSRVDSGKMPMRGSPAPRSSDVSPAQRTPDWSLDQKIPSASPDQTAPDGSVHRRTPSGSPDRSAANGSDDGSTPNASPVRRTPDEISGRRTPDEISTRTTSNETSARTTSNETSTRRTPDGDPSNGNLAGGISSESPAGGISNESPTGGISNGSPTGGISNESPTGSSINAISARKTVNGSPDFHPVAAQESPEDVVVLRQLDTLASVARRMSHEYVAKPAQVDLYVGDSF